MSVTAVFALIFMVLVVAAGATVLWRKRHATGPAFRPLFIGFLTIGALIISAMVWRLSGEANRSELLAGLNAADVTAVTAGATQIQDIHLSAIIAALNSCRPLADEGVHRRLTTERTQLRILLTQGEPVVAVARRDPDSGGAVLDFENWSGQGHKPGESVGGSMLCAELPGALATAGVPLL